MQAKEKGMVTDSSETQESALSPHDKKHSSGGEMSANSHELHDESRHKSAGDILHEGHPEDQTMSNEEKLLDHGQHEGMKHGQHEGMKHEGHAPSGGKDHGDHHTHMLEDFKKRFIVSFILTFPVLLLSPTIQDFFNFELSVHIKNNFYKFHLYQQDKKLNRPLIFGIILFRIIQK